MANSVDNVVDHPTFKKKKWTEAHSDAMERMTLLDNLHDAREALEIASRMYADAYSALKYHDEMNGIDYSEDDD